MNLINNKRVIIVLFTLSLGVTNLKSQTDFIWGKQIGSDRDEYSFNHVNDNKGNIYITGKTNGAIDGENFGKNDGFISKSDSLGNTIWKRQFGSVGDEDVLWSAIDNTGCIYITGSTTGVLNIKNNGKEDVFIVKYNPVGEKEWSRQFGTDSTDIARGIFADNNGNIYLTGMTSGKLGKTTYGKSDCFIIKIDRNGNLLFISQFGTSGEDCGYAITGSTNSDIFVCGTTWGDIGGMNSGFIDAFTGQFTEKGTLIKYNQFGTEGFDIPMILCVDEEKYIYVGGSTSGNMGCQQIGEGDCFLLKMNYEGDLLWKNQFGTKKHDGIRGIVFYPNKSGNILVSGLLNLPPAQAFLRMYDKKGALHWEQKFVARGQNGDTSGKFVTVDNDGNVYYMGLTGANMFGPLIGEHDVFLVKLTPTGNH